ncbi:MAG: YfdX family protein [Xanthobacteraceae bacterium]
MNGKLLASSAAALALASSLFALPASAESAKNAPKPTANTTAPAATTTAPADAKADAKTGAKSEALSIMRYSEDGGRAIREIGAARVAIFNGDTKLASELIIRAKASVAKAEQEAPTFKVQNEESGKAGAADETVKAQMVPVDGDLVLAEDFVPTPDKRARIEKANEHFKNGNAKDALEELRLGDIAVMYTRAWMPLAAAAKHLDQAVKFMDAQKYYEANLSLKAIGDSIAVDSVAINEAVKPKS